MLELYQNSNDSHHHYHLLCSGALASSLPCSWTTPPGAGVDPGEHLTYKSAAIIHQVVIDVIHSQSENDPQF